MSPHPVSLVAAGGLLGGFALARRTQRRRAGGALFAAAGMWCLRSWRQTAGPKSAAAMGAGYVAAMGVSHPLAKKLGPWPSVVAVTAATAGVSEVVTRRAGLRK